MFSNSLTPAEQKCIFDDLDEKEKEKVETKATRND